MHRAFTGEEKWSENINKLEIQVQYLNTVIHSKSLSVSKLEDHVTRLETELQSNKKKRDLKALLNLYKKY